MAVRVRWREHASVLAGGAALLLGGSRLTDVTLVAGGACVKAHRLLLATTSRLFRDIFDSNPGPHPVIVLPGVSAESLNSILSYVYKGEVAVPEAELPTLLQAAELLEIEGLFAGSDEEEPRLLENGSLQPKSEPLDAAVEEIIRDGFESTLSVDNPTSDVNPSIFSIKDKRISKRRLKKLKNRIVTKTNKENESLPTPNPVETDYDETIVQFKTEHTETPLFIANEGIDHDTDTQEEMCFAEDDLRKDDNFKQTFPCPFCIRVYHSWGYRRRHVKAHHDTKSLPCKYCLVQLDSEVAWFDHVVKDHGIRRSSARDSLVIMVEAHSVLSCSSPPSPVSMLNHLQLDTLSTDDCCMKSDESCEA